MKKSLPLIIFTLLLVGGGYYWWKAEAKNPQASAMARPPQAVSVLELQPQVISFTQQLPGRITSFRQSQIRPQVNGIIIKRLFEEGSRVEEGKQLYQIDDTRYKAALNSSLADLKSANAYFKTAQAREARYKDLVKINAVSVQEYDDIKAEFDQASAAIAVTQAAVDVAKVNLDYTKVYAPISGRISRSFITEGALVTANQAQHLAQITQLDPVYVDMQQSSAEALTLHARLMGKDAVPVHLILDEKLDKRYPLAGEVKFSEVTVGESTGSIALRALMPNPTGMLLPGLFVQATLDLGQSEVLLVPQRATIRTPAGGLTVWVVNDGKAQSRPIDVEQAYNNSWIVLNGLKAGDTVIVEGYQKVSPDAPVSVTPWLQSDASSQSSPADKG